LPSSHVYWQAGAVFTCLSFLFLMHFQYCPHGS
jgi:hypothetical protein